MLLLLTTVAPALAAAPSAPVSEAQVIRLAGSEVGVQSLYVRLPRRAVGEKRPMQVLIALHGMGGNGDDFARDLVDQADRNGWLLVAPTIKYGDWKDPLQIQREDPRLVASLARLIENLPTETGQRVRRRVLLLGHSRGAQLAHRFALFQPDRVLAVASLSAGHYTLPAVKGPLGKPLQFPYGLEDVQKLGGRAFNPLLIDTVQFWVGVGANDNNPNDLPRAWDPYLGTTRVQRARAFAAAVREVGASARLTLFNGAGHGLTADMRDSACAFLRTAALIDANVLPPPSKMRGSFVAV